MFPKIPGDNSQNNSAGITEASQLLVEFVCSQEEPGDLLLEFADGVSVVSKLLMNDLHLRVALSFNLQLNDHILDLLDLFAKFVVI